MYKPLLSHEDDQERGYMRYPSLALGDNTEDEEELWDRSSYPESTNLLAGGEKTYDDVEAKEKKLGYPKSVFFIIGNEFCERFSYYGMKAILTLYLKFQLMFNEDDSTIIYHVWAMLCYFTPVIGAIIADTFLGRFRTIFYISIIYVIGNAVLSISAIPPLMPDLNTKIAVSLIGLLLIALGTGGIKPCVSAFGGDQFVLPQQERQLAQFFSIFYFSINAGSLISTFVTPVLRDDIKCFNDDCYSLAFGVPAVLMLVALVLFLLGYSMYTIKPPEGNIVVRVGSCVAHALRNKSKSKEKKEHWLDHASDKYEPKLINDVKILLKILVLYIPLPFFWALFDQQGSRWTFQATRMSGDVGGWTIKPDQMQVINPFFILMLIPIFDSFVYPLLAKCNLLTKPLTRIFTGGVLAGVAFLISGFLELKLETTYPVPVKSLETRLSFINGLPCDVTLNLPFEEEQFTLKHLEEKVFKSVAIDGVDLHLNVTLDLDTSNCGNIEHFNDILQTKVFEKTAHVIMITADSNVVKLMNIDPPDEIEKSSEGLPKLRMLYNLDQNLPFGSAVLIKGKTEFRFFINEKDQGHISGTEFMDVEPETFEVFLPTEDNGTESSPVGSFSVKMGGVYDFMVHKPLDGTNETSVTIYEVTPANTVHMLWLIPQYFVITVSEIMFSITGLEFSFMQAPSSMKSVLQAAWLLTVAFGNLIVVIIAEAKFFQRQALEFFLFAVLMFVDMVAFAALAVRYKYVDQNGEIEDTKNEKQGKSGKENEAYSDDETNF
ncbi:solute carrier family 15 member 2-like isoform X2 [Penaeus japonicus]|uniref:solute carrier family 15 member 2-like isoform X2 n=1 Tax=Penaeus japonicus TaxID=27405 RepID=UPI001C70F1AC|nr:solute carrier family 15 member 2-like isoform X2 [Penaeus japonicus]